MIKSNNDYYKPMCRWDITGKNNMATYKTTFQCAKCGAIVPTIQHGAGFLRGYGSGQLQDGPCPAGGSHDWHELTKGEWIDD